MKNITGKITIISAHLGMEDGSWVKFKLRKREEITGYTHYPEERKIVVDRSLYARDGFCNVYIEECYRVEHIRRNKYWLYLLEDVETEPDDYYFRLKVRFYAVSLEKPAAEPG